MPPDYIGAIMTGNGLAGIIASLAKIALLLTVDDGFTAAIIIFSVIFVYFLVCAYGFQIVNNSEFYNYHKRQVSEPKG